MRVHCVECGQLVNNYEAEEPWEHHQLCVACFVAWTRLARTTVRFTDLDEVFFDPPLTDVPPEVAERIRSRADQTRLP